MKMDQAFERSGMSKTRFSGLIYVSRFLLLLGAKSHCPP